MHTAVHSAIHPILRSFLAFQVYGSVKVNRTEPNRDNRWRRFRSVNRNRIIIMVNQTALVTKNLNCIPRQGFKVI